MNERIRVLITFGTRPEAIKMAPVVERLRERADRFEAIVAVTAQHREMLDQVLEQFRITPTYDLDIMTEGQTLTQITTRALKGLSPLIEQTRPDAMLVQGDTTSTFAAALAAFYHHVPVGHVEAGLRTGNLEQPFPEEANRRLTTRLARWHFAPTALAQANLLSEGVEPSTIYVTGNTVVDALTETASQPFAFPSGPVSDALSSGRRIVLVTAHRRENWGEPYRNICAAVSRLVRDFDDIHVLFATHSNPELARAAAESLRDTARVDLIGPQGYAAFVHLMRASVLMMSDSGGVQEEAPTLGTPVLVLRDLTERSEAVEAGAAMLVGTNTDRIVQEASRLLSQHATRESTACTNPFGDGHAAERIVDVLEGELHTHRSDDHDEVGDETGSGHA